MKEKYILSNNLEVASLKFLINDMRKTYNSDSSISRLINGKNKKDYLRYLELVNIYKTKLFTETSNKILNETDFELNPEFQIFKERFDKKNREIIEQEMQIIKAEQEKNKIERLKLDIIEDITIDIDSVGTENYYYKEVLIREYKSRRETNTKKIVFSFNMNKLKNDVAKITPSKLKRQPDRQTSQPSIKRSAKGGFGFDSIEITSYDLLTMEDEKERNEFRKLLKNTEFKSCYKLMNKKINKKILKKLFKNINFNTNECKIETNDIIPPF
jgi:hypothetical protein